MHWQRRDWQPAVMMDAISGQVEYRNYLVFYPAMLIGAGITQVRTLDGQVVQEGLVLSDKLRPSRRGGLPVLFVERNQDAWIPIKLD